MYWDYFETGYVDDLDEHPLDAIPEEPEYIVNTYGDQNPLFDEPPRDLDPDDAYDRMREEQANEIMCQQSDLERVAKKLPQVAGDGKQEKTEVA